MRFLVIFAPTTSWWWKETRPSGLEAPRPRLADVVQQGRQPQRQVGAVLLQVDGLLQDGQRVLVDVLVPMVLVPLQPQRGDLRQHPVREPGLHQQPDALDAGGARAAACSARPAPAPPRRCRSGRPCPSSRPSTSSATVKSSCAAKRAARIIRSGSSEKDASGAPGVRSTRAARSSRPPCGSMKVFSGQRDRHRVHREVAADQVLLDGVAVGDLGLARGAVVGLRAVGGDLDLEAARRPPSRVFFWQPTVPKAIPTSHTASAQGRTMRSTSSGRASVVKSRSLPSRPSSASRTEPPTSARLNPASWKRRARSSATGETRSSSLTAGAAPR